MHDFSFSLPTPPYEDSWSLEEEYSLLTFGRAEEIQQFEGDKIVLLDDIGGPEDWFLAVDSLHCLILLNPSCFSHKYGHGGLGHYGLAYELGILLNCGLLWM